MKNKKHQKQNRISVKSDSGSTNVTDENHSCCKTTMTLLAQAK